MRRRGWNPAGNGFVLCQPSGEAGEEPGASSVVIGSGLHRANIPPIAAPPGVVLKNNNVFRVGQEKLHAGEAEVAGAVLDFAVEFAGGGDGAFVDEHFSQFTIAPAVNCCALVFYKSPKDGLRWCRCANLGNGGDGGF